MNEFEVRRNSDRFEFESESRTGLAVANVGNTDGTLTIREFDASGPEIPGSPAVITLSAGEHRAFFLDEVITVPSGFIIGLVVIESSTPEVTAVALKFDDAPEDEEEGQVRNEFTISPVIQIE